MVAVASDNLVAVLQRHLHADHDRFLADIEMAEAADRAHAIEWPAFSSNRRIRSMLRSAANSCSLVNSGGELTLALSGTASLRVRSWQIPDQRRLTVFNACAAIKSRVVLH